MNKKKSPKELSKQAQKLKLGIYQHFKGPEYRVLGVGRLSEDREQEMVIYKSLNHDAIWLRPIEMFCEAVDRPEYHHKGSRFTFMREE